jgi:hypothetical protein
MTNKQHAFIFIHKFYFALPNNGSMNTGLCNCNQRYSEALTCALIAVNEIIKVIDPDVSNIDFKTWLYYKEIKHEIENITEKYEQSKCVI